MVLKVVIGFAVFSSALAAADPSANPTATIPLTLPAGLPLRLYLTKRVSKKLNAPVEAKLLTPVYAFDHEVIPAGVPALGHVSRVQPVSKWTRARAILGGDFSPLHIAQIEFTSIKLADGSSIEIHTVESAGLNTLVPLKPPKKRAQPAPDNRNAGIIATGKQQAKDAINAQIDRVKSIPDIVRGPGKKEMIYDYAMSRLPYHPQYLHSRMRFDAVLDSPLDFGTEKVAPESVEVLGSQPAPGSIAHARLLTQLDSKTSSRGEEVQAVLEEPLFSADHKLVFPEGSLVDGSVVNAKPARWFHRGGKLLFGFQNVTLSPQAAEILSAPSSAPADPRDEAPKPEKKLEIRTEGTLSAAEGGNAALKVDKEGGVTASESKKRFIATAAAVWVASRAADNDPIRNSNGAATGQSQNIGGRTLGGGMGFGLLGSIAAQTSRTVGKGFGFYGLGWSVFSTVIARGAEVQFDKNAVIDISFGERKPDDPGKLGSAGTPAAK